MLDTKIRPENAENLIQILHFRAYCTPEKIAYEILDSNLNPYEITYSELYFRVSNFALRLLKNKIVNGDRCLLIFHRELDFIISYLACNLIGAIPIPLNMPKRNSYMDKWENISKDSEARCILTERENVEFLKEKFAFSSCKHLSSLSIYFEKEKSSDSKDKAAHKNNDISFLQYTSGSTGIPKGVIVTNSSLLNNMKQIEKNLNFCEESIMVSWLPFYHDLGLIYGILQGIYSGYKVILMNPDDFMENPISWLKAITTYKATHTAAPNFAYELISNEIDNKPLEVKDIKLNTLKAALCAGEPVNIKTLNRFCKKTKAFGFNDCVLSPAYGLAEATLIISCHKVSKKVSWIKLNRSDYNSGIITILDKGYLGDFKDTFSDLADNEIYLVSNGSVIDEHKVVIKKADDKKESELEVNNIGEICFFGPSITNGYWGSSEKNKGIFKYDENSNEMYLKTGDLGFIDDSGELYVTGRKKELIIIRGMNYYPQDIEKTSFYSEEYFVKNGAAAFSILENGEEKLILIQEIVQDAVRNHQCKSWGEHIRENILKVHGIKTEIIVFVPPLSIPRTISGKIQRVKCKKIFENNCWTDALEILDFKKDIMKKNKAGEVLKTRGFNKETLESFMIELMAEKLGIEVKEVNKNISFMELGINSIMSLAIRNAIEENLGIKISSTLLFNYNTAAQMSEYLTSALNPKSIVKVEQSIENDRINIIMENQSIEDDRINIITKNQSIEDDKISSISEINKSMIENCSEDEIFELLKKELGCESVYD
ncbi:non-ribosomal peptide synthetase [Clostridium beijerinckii]|uniref:non-ribosomal peptide synthetase n=1 Tax=Clostridium beijerinckii TaxID=1520 RepID=UPI00080A4702|nr:non-ribosomal peptide synthetase [Clostridium beijerinckii]OCA97947.1 AMP-dependent synthetase [Clostridium beijerinckii]